MNDGIVERVDMQASRRPTAVAIETEDTALSYRDLVVKAEALAMRLRDAGLTPGQHVALICPAGMSRLVAALAILRAGGVYAPIDPGLSATQADALVAHADCAMTLRGGDDDADVVLSGRRTEAPCSDGAYLRFTSGSSGLPKAILHSRRTALRLGEAFATSVGVEAHDRVTLFNPFWHTLIWGTLISGATLCLLDLRRSTPAALVRALATRRVTIYSSFPTAFRQLVATVEPGHRIASIRRISLSGETLTVQDVAEARRCFAPDCVLINSYGASELGHISSFAIDPAMTVPQAGVPVGFPVPDVALRLVDADATRLPTDELGEIAVRCAHLPHGYWRRPDLDARSFVADPESPSERLYLTGDIGRFDAAGALIVVGRKDRQVKIRGHRVLPEEVESVLATHPDLRDVAVTAVEHWSGNTQLAAAVVTIDGKAPTPRELRAFAATRLPDYMVPLRIEILPGLPRTASGKLDWQALVPAPAVQPTASPVPVDVTQTLELQVLQIWEELLSARPIGLDEDFFALGGDSLTAAQVALRVEALLQRDVPVTALYDTPTIRRFVIQCQRDLPLEPPVYRLNPAGTRRALFFLHPDLHAAAYCRALAGLLPADQPVIVIAPQGRTRDEVLPPSIEAMAIDRAGLLQALQPTGPIALAGFCNGALIAFETARQLARRGRDVDMLAMIDPPSFTVLPLWIRRAIALGDGLVGRLARRPAVIARIVGGMLNEAHGRLEQAARREHHPGIALLRAALSPLARPLLGRHPTPPKVPPPESEPTWRLLYDRLNAVALGYLPGTIPITLDVITTSTGSRPQYRPERWRRLAPKVALHRIDASHLGCLTREAAKLAVPLREILGRRAP